MKKKLTLLLLLLMMCGCQVHTSIFEFRYDSNGRITLIAENAKQDSTLQTSLEVKENEIIVIRSYLEKGQSADFYFYRQGEKEPAVSAEVSGTDYYELEAEARTYNMQVTNLTDINGTVEISTLYVKPTTQQINPWKTAENHEEIIDHLGFDITVPDSIKKTSYSEARYAASLKMLEARYYDAETKALLFYIRKAPLEAVSDRESFVGIWLEYDSVNEEEDLTYSVKEDTIRLAEWENDTYAYCLYSEEGLTYDEVREIVSLTDPQ